jgi:hypothetical protein
MWFNMMVLRHVTVVKYNIGCPKIILDAGLVEDKPASSPDLKPTEFFLCVDILNPRSPPVQSTRERNCGGQKDTPSESSNASEILFHAQLAEICVRKYGGHLEHLL